MKIYQLRLTDLNLLLEPVFKTKESALMFQNKYLQRKISIEENVLDNLCNNHVYRILTNDEEGYELLDNIFTDEKIAREYIESCQVTNCKIVKEDILTDNNFNYHLIEV